MQEKYGFVYLWRDNKNGRYYVGCHWGNENDGYICSSSWMKKAYKYRPQDFKRRILTTNILERYELLEEEYKWLQLIKDDELGKRYYNLSKKHFGHWTVDKENYKTTQQKIIESRKDPKFLRIARECKLGDLNPMKRPEVAESVAKKNRGRIAWNIGIPRTDEQKKYHSEKTKGRIAWNRNIKMDDMQKEIISIREKKRSSERIWYYDPMINKSIHIFKNDLPPEGYILGKAKRSQESKNKMRLSRLAYIERQKS
jgi:hypothetical protein